MRKWFRFRWRRFFLLGVVTIVGAVAVVRFWVIPALIVAEIRKHHEGYVTIRGWWIGRSSGGVNGLTLHESSSPFSPVWATAERVTTDLSIGALLRGRLTPRQVTILAPRIVYRIGEDGRPTTAMPFKLSSNGATPVLVAVHGRLTLTQTGRPEMVVETVNGRLDPDQNGSRFRIWSGDAGWGRPVIDGRFGPAYRSIKLRLIADRLKADREKAARIPFVSEKIWSYFDPKGPVSVVVDLERPNGWSGPSVIKTMVTFERTNIVLPHLRLTASDAVGRMIYEDQFVRVDGMRGEMLGGRVAVSGTMDFHRQESQSALTVGVERADMTSVPASWGLETIGLTGRLTGTARLFMRLHGSGLDMTGSTGQGTIAEATIQGISLGRLGLKVRGEGVRANVSNVDQGVFSPQWIGADFEVRDVELKRAVAQVGAKNGAVKIPVSGRLSLWLALRMPLGTLHDPNAWSASGRVVGPEVAFRSMRFREVSGTVALQGGRVNVSDLAARLDGHLFTGEGDVDLAAPHAFLARLDAADFPLAELAALASSTAGPANVFGTVAAHAEASGTLSPWRVEHRGRAKIEQAEAGQVSIGDVPIEWETRGKTVVVTAREIQRYGGRLSAEARIPVLGDGPIEGTMTLSEVDTARLSAEVPGSLRLTGNADGHARFRLSMNDDRSAAEGEARLTAAKMTIEGVPATSLRATLAVHDGVPKFEAHAEGFDGALAVKGSGESGQGSGGFAIDADVRAVGLQLASLWEALGKSSGPLAQVQGSGEVAALVRTRGSVASTHAVGSVELRELKWGDYYELGHVRAGFDVSPDCLRVEDLSGALWGSPIHGEFWRRTNGHQPAQFDLNLRLERASLTRIFAFQPALGRRFEGYASFSAQAHSVGSFRGRAEFRVAHGRVHRLPIVGLSIPIAWDVTPGKDLAGRIQVRKASARVAGGRLQGEATVQLGPFRDIHAELTLDRIDTRAISRAESRARRPMPGVIDGVITVDSPNFALADDYTGTIDLDLTGASLVDVPILDCLDRALGSARGAVFDEGDLHGRIAHRAIHVERLTLIGPLAQLHATGTVDFDGRLDLRAIVNTNDIVPTNGLLAIGQLSNAVSDARINEEAIDRMADFLSSRLMKFRIRGTVAHPSYSADGSIHVGRIAIAFFVEAMREAASSATP